MSKFLASIAFHGAIAAMYYLWQIEGIAQAGNVFLFALWTYAVLGILVGIAAKDGDWQGRDGTVVFATNWVFRIAFLFAVVWVGHIVTGAFYLLGLIGIRVLQTKKAKEAKA